jgi:S-adenosylmethionine/arginine decarboxylase-like enzyme
LIDIQSLSNNIYDDLWSNTIEHLSNTQQQRHIIQSSTSIKLLDCTIENEQILNIALADKVIFIDF